MKISQSFYTRDFIGDTPKAAYLSACEWVAKTILSKGTNIEESNLLWSITRIKDAKEPMFRLELFFSYEESEVNEKTCEICKTLHNSFFSNEKYNCDKCNKEAFRRRLEQKSNTGCSCYKEKINRVLDKF